MSDLEVGLSDNYQKITKNDEDHEHKEELNLENTLSPTSSPPLPSQNLIQGSLPSLPKPKRSSNQIKALVYKNLRLQSRQIGTNILQIMTPLICLALILVIEKWAESVFPETLYSFPIPFIFNVPSFYNIFKSNFLPVKLTTCLQWYYYDFADGVSQETIDYIGIKDENSDMMTGGMLSNVINSYNCSYTSFNSTEIIYNKIPYFRRPPTNSSINEEMYKELQFLNNQPYRRFEDLMGLEFLPDGTVKFYSASDDNLTFTMQINDLRIPEYHRNNGITKMTLQNKEGGQSFPTLIVADGELSLLDLISRSYLHQLNNSVWLISGIQYMPMKDQDKGWLLKIINITGASLYPLALSLLLPVFMYAMVLEKEERILAMMKMNGMKMMTYWTVNYLFNFTIFCIMAITFLLFGYHILKLSFFTSTDPLLLGSTMIGWGLSQVSLSLFYQVFLTKARSATIVGYLLSIWTILIAVSFNVAVYPDPYHLPYGMRMYPPFGFCRIIYLLSIACSNQECYRSINAITEEIKDCLIFLYIGAFFFFILAIYLHEVVPQDYGISKSPFFFLHPIRKFFKKGKKIEKTYKNIPEDVNSSPYFQETEDPDCQKERNFVNSFQGNYDQYPLICKGVRKVYKGSPVKIAVNDFYLAVQKGEIFGLLGPNGAGKTTLISMLTGLYSADQGDAWVAGSSIKDEIGQVHLKIGVCPQFDVLWPDLTVEEHLLFYARLKGVGSIEEKAKLDKAIKEVGLEGHANFKAQELSGGMKRRLSVAIALVGEPKIIFLDEPTTGLDPGNKSQLCDILMNLKGKRAMVVTTHSMEEADILCSRIGIITNGVLRCIGPQIRLKSLYGNGYHLFVNCHKERYFENLQNNQRFEESNEMMIREERKLSASEYHEKAFKYIKEIIPNAEPISIFNGNFIFQVPMEGLEVSKLIVLLNSRKNELMICDWGISQSNLEDVFMRIVESGGNEKKLEEFTNSNEI